MAKRKRCANGYNLFIKACSEDKPFGECLTERGWSKLGEKEKSKWNDDARKKCNIGTE